MHNYILYCNFAYFKFDSQLNKADFASREKLKWLTLDFSRKSSRWFLREKKKEVGSFESLVRKR